MQPRNKISNLLLFLAIILYAVTVFPPKQTLFIALFGIFSSLIFEQQKDTLLMVFSAIAQFVTKIRPNKPDQLHTEVVNFCASLNQYENYMQTILTRKKRLFFMLSKRQQNEVISNYKRLKKIEEKVNLNQRFLSRVSQFVANKYGISQLDLISQRGNGAACVDLIEHFVRDYSVLNHQREELFAPILEKIKPLRGSILVPGSGLGRLGFEIAKSNAEVEVNMVELSSNMFLGSQFALNESLTDEIYPHLTYFSHWRHGADQLEAEKVKFFGKPSNLKLSYQNFMDCGYHDAVVTLFFIDTAQNVVDLIEKVYDILPRKGKWINYGPLKWGTAAYAELSGDELLAYIKTKFNVEEVWDEGSNRYNGSDKSMIISKYKLLGFVATKR